jgi:hypothetical protein
MLTKRRVKIPIFNYLMFVYVFDEWEDLKDNIPHELYSIPNANGITIEYDSYCVVCVPSHTKHKSTIVHESGHVKNLVWKYIGYTPQRDNDEVDRYLQAYIFEAIEKIISKYY